MTASILQLPRPSGDEVEIAWATHRALIRAELADPSLKLDRAHNLAKQKAEQEFTRLFDEWVRG
jgi:hypothetical protein